MQSLLCEAVAFVSVYLYLTFLRVGGYVGDKGLFWCSCGPQTSEDKPVLHLD